MLDQKVNTSGNSFIKAVWMLTYLFRCGEIKIKSGDDLNSLTLTQLSATSSIIDLRTEVPFADMYLTLKDFHT